MLILSGVARLGRDAELRYTNDSQAVANLSLAFNYGRKDGNGDRPTQWVEASLWGARAEGLADYLKKGQAFAVVVEDAHIETFDRNGGGVGHKLTGRVLSIDFAGPAPDGQGQRGNGQGAQRPQGQSSQRGVGYGQQRSQGDRNGGANNRQQGQQRGRDVGGFDDMPDDIPY